MLRRRSLSIATALLTAPAALLLLTPACKKKDPPAPPPASKVAATPTSPMPGALDEASFKALHELKPGAAPAAKGTMALLPGGAKVYLSLPPGAKGPLPGVLVVHEWWGLNDNTKHWADRLAADGYAALAVDLFDGKVATTPDQAMMYMKGADPAKSAAILKAAHTFLASDPRVGAKKRGAIGWCFGGRQVLLHAMATPDLDAAVVYYGSPESDPAKLKAIKAPLLGIFANKDKHITTDAVNQFEAGLKAAGVAHRLLRYDADHAFANPSQKVYDTTAATAAWTEASEFLRAKLK